MKARLVNVILVEDGANQSYYTLEGLAIGVFKSGKQEKPALEPEPKAKGGVVTSPTPEEIAQNKEKDTERLIDKIRGTKESNR